MSSNHRPRQLVAAALSAGLVLALAACAQDYPNSTFNHHTEFNTQIDFLWDRLLFWGTVVFVLVEVALIYTIFKFRHREGAPTPKQVHGNTTLEIIWTIAPALILVLIAVPTVRTIFRTQAPAVPDALQVEVIGHQWWWEFRYPEYGVRTANELYLPVGRTVNLTLRSNDVIHSFWVPQLGGKRDLITNRTNYLWFTPDSSLESTVWNGFCAEFCGPSHANMKFRTYTVQPEEFERWIANQQAPAAFGAVAPAAPAAASEGGEAVQVAAADSVAAPAATSEPYWFPKEELPAYAIPTGRIPARLAMPEGMVGDPQRGLEVYSRSTCIGCHAINGNPMSISRIGPDLTHVGSRHTIAAGMFPHEADYLFAWIKNSRALKPGSLMIPVGIGERDPITGMVITERGGLNDQQIADIVAYLQALK